MQSMQIKATQEYDSFKLMGGNRKIDYNHVEKLKTAMLENPDWFKTKPAVVNEARFIIDGQHRLQAAKHANLPFYYVVSDKMSLSAARAMNIRQKQWTIQDYAQSYADAGDKNYQFIVELDRKFPTLSIGVLINIVGGGLEQGFDLSSKFRDGRFEVKDTEEALADVNFFNEISKLSQRRVNVPFVRTMMSVRRRDDFDENRFTKNLEAQPELLIVASLARDNYRTIEDVYNYNRSMSNHVRFY